MTVLSSNPSSVVSAGTWTGGANTYLSDNVYATNTGSVQNTEYPLDVGGFNFAAIPAGSTINSVTVTMEAKTGTSNRAQIKGELLDGTTVLGTRALANLTTADVAYTFTPTATLAQLQSANLKVRVTNKRIVSQASTTSVDWVKIDVDYTAPLPVLSQAAYRFYGDGTESGSIALAAQDTSLPVDKSGGDLPMQLRVRVQEGGGGVVPATDDFQLQWEKNGSGTWRPVQTLIARYATAPNPLNGSITAVGEMRGQSFLGNGGTLSRVGFHLDKVGTPSDNFTAVLYAHSGTFGVDGVGTGSVLDTSAPVAESSVVAGGGWVYFDFGGTTVLTAGTPYFILVKASPTANITNYIRVTSQNSGVTPGTDPGNSVNFTSATWFPSDNDVLFEVNVTASTVAPYDSANLDVLADSYPEANISGTVGLSPILGYKAGQSFVGDGQPLARVGFHLGKSGGFNGTVTAALYSHSGTLGATSTGSARLATSTTSKTGAEIGTTPGWVYFNFDGAYTLVAGTPYVVVVEITTASTGTVSLSQDPSSPTHPGNRCGYTGTWGAYPNDDLIFSVYTFPPTTSRLTGGSGTFVAGKISSDGLVDDLGLSQGNHTELLYSLKLLAADFTLARDTLRFRVVRNGAVLNTYAQVPTITVTGATVLRDVFDNTPAETYTAYNDGQTGLWTGNQFYTYGAPVYTGWMIAGVRIYIPPGAPAGILTAGGKVSWAGPQPGDDYWSFEDAPGNAISRLMEAGNQKAFSTLAPGWNDIFFDTPFAWTHAKGAFVGISWTTGGYYVHALPASPAAFPARDGTRLARSEHGTSSGELMRGVNDAGGYNWSTAAYGLDIILAEPAAPAGPQTYQVSGTVAVTTAASGASTRVPRQFAASGSVPVVTTASGAATVVGGAVTHQVAGTVAVNTAATGAVSLRQPVSGSVPVTVEATGAVSARLPASGVVAVTTAVSGTADVSGMPPGWEGGAYPVMVRTTVSGNVTVVAGSVTHQVSGTVAVVTGAAGEVSARLSVSGIVPVVTAAVGAATRVPVTHQVSGVVAVLTEAQGAITSRQNVSGSVPVQVGAAGAVSARLTVSGSVPVIVGVFGTPTRVPVTHSVSGSVAVLTDAAGSLNVIGGAQQYPVAGTVAVVTDAAGAVTRVPVMHQVSGSVPVLTEATGAVTRVPVVHQVAGTVPVLAGVTGAVSARLSVSGTVPVLTATTGAPTRVPVVHQVAGVVPVVTAATGAVSSRQPVSGIVPVLTTVSGDVTRVPIVHQVSGAVAVSTDVNGGVSTQLQVAGSVPVVVTAAGAIGAQMHQVAGTVVVVTTGASGTIAKQSPVAGTVAVVTAASGTVSSRLPVSGVVPVVVGASGTPSSKQGVSGTVAVVTTVVGNAVPPGGLQGTVPVTVGVTGAVTSRQGVAGTPAAVTTGVSGAVTSRQQLVGVAPVTVGVSGSAEINPRGRVDVVTSVSGAVTQVHQVSGRVDVVTGSAGTTAGGQPVSGAVAITTTVSGAVTSRQQVSGTVAVSTAAIGSATLVSGAVTHQVSGTVAVSTTSSAQVGRGLAVSGVVNVVTASQGQVTARLSVAGTVPVQTTASGTLRQIAQVSGTVGVLTGAAGQVSAKFWVSGQAHVHTAVYGAAGPPPTGGGFPPCLGVRADSPLLGLVMHAPVLTLSAEAPRYILRSEASC